MTDTNLIRSRGRPRRFDADQAVETAQALFHQRGYDSVSLADLTEALGIKPPSFYSAFGSKGGLFEKVVDRYNRTDAIPFSRILSPERPVAEALLELLEEGARRYAADTGRMGCIVIEGTHSHDAEARKFALTVQVRAEEMVRAFVAARYPDKAEAIADFVSTTLAGLSSKARNGQSAERLMASARLAGAVITSELAD